MSAGIPHDDLGKGGRPVLVIPAYDETQVLALEQGRLAAEVVLVVNEPPGAPSERSPDLLARYAGREDVRILDLTGSCAVAGGVGEARARGFEAALEGLPASSKPSTWVRTTDADVVLPDDYWNAFDVTCGTAVCVYPFEHEAPEPRLQPHVDAYEASLRYYVLGLAYAGSPYAFHTVGSTLAINAQSYEQVRGFPRRQAGEDFYVLNKLAKVGAIERLACTPLRLSGRSSHRVPFGTGTSVATSVAEGDRPWQRRTYHPQTFRVLGIVLGEFARAVERREEREQRVATAVYESINSATKSTAAADAAVARLAKDGTLKALVRSCRERSRGNDRLRAVHTHFDAFRTLKLVHTLRDEVFGSVGLEEALRAASFLSAPTTDGALRDNAWLREAERQLPRRRGLCVLTLA